MISSILLDISLPFSCCCFSFLFLFLPFPIQRSLFLFFSVLLRLFSSHFSSFLLFQFPPSFPHSLALFDLSLPSRCSSSSSVSSSISTSFFLFSSFLFFLFSFFFLPLLFSSYPSVTISSIFLVISWERCSPLPHFIHPCNVLWIPDTPHGMLQYWRSQSYLGGGGAKWNNLLDFCLLFPIFPILNHFLPSFSWFLAIFFADRGGTLSPSGYATEYWNTIPILPNSRIW